MELQNKKLAIHEYKSIKSQKAIPRTRKKKFESLDVKRKRQMNIARRQEAHFNKFISRKTNKSADPRNKDKQRREQMFKNKMKDKYSNVDTRFYKTTKAMVAKRRDKFDPETDTAKGGVVLAGNLVRVSGKAIPNWRLG
jgi:hypothetical protein